MKRLPILMAVLILVSILAGCSSVIYERKKDETKPLDEGVETKLKLEGPRAVMQTKF